MFASVRRHPLASFLTTASAILIACLVILRMHPSATHADVAAWGATFDLTITIPVLYWVFFVRSGRARPLTIAPVFLVGTVLASVVIPRGQQQFLHELGRFAVPIAEMLLIGALVRRVIKTAKLRSVPSDPYERIVLAARTLAGDNRAAKIIASEVAMLYFAFLGWRRKPESVPGRAITFHERNGWSTIAACILVLIAAEGIGMHFLLGIWSTTAAWAWTALDVWAAIWIIGDAQALRLRRSFVTSDALHIRHGMRWNVIVPRELIASIDEIRDESTWKRKGVLKLAILDEPRWLVTLREPVIAHGLLGMRKEVRALALLPDQEDVFSDPCTPR
jgi:hypothetical protein